MSSFDLSQCLQAFPLPLPFLEPFPSPLPLPFPLLLLPGSVDRNDHRIHGFSDRVWSEDPFKIHLGAFIFLTQPVVHWWLFLMVWKQGATANRNHEWPNTACTLWLCTIAMENHHISMKIPISMENMITDPHISRNHVKSSLSVGHGFHGWPLQTICRRLCNSFLSAQLSTGTFTVPGRIGKITMELELEICGKSLENPWKKGTVCPTVDAIPWLRPRMIQPSRHKTSLRAPFYASSPASSWITWPRQLQEPSIDWDLDEGG